MPERTADIDRLFAEGHPTLSMLDNLQAGQSFPLLQDCLGSDAPLDVAAQVLCVPGTVAKIAATPGVMDELLRLLHNEYGYAPPPRASKVHPDWNRLRSMYCSLNLRLIWMSHCPMPSPVLQWLPCSTRTASLRCVTACVAAMILAKATSTWLSVWKPSYGCGTSSGTTTNWAVAIPFLSRSGTTCTTYNRWSRPASWTMPARLLRNGVALCGPRWASGPCCGKPPSAASSSSKLLRRAVPIWSMSRKSSWTTLLPTSTATTASGGGSSTAPGRTRGCDLCRGC